MAVVKPKPYYDPIVAPLPKGVYQDPVSSPWNLANIPGTAQWQAAQKQLTGTYGIAPSTVGAPPTAAAATPTPTVSAPAPVRKAGFWTTPDYASMIPGDWEVTGAEAAGRQATGEAESAFQKSLRQAFIDFGGDTGKLGDYAKYIDEPTIKAAQENKFSQTAQALRQMTKTLAQQRAARAARGMSTSGAAVGQTRQTLESREQADYNALRGFLGGAEQGEQGLAGLRRDIADKIAAARSQAGARLAASNPAFYTPGDEVPGVPEAGPAAPPPPTQTQTPWGGITWGGHGGITTKAQLQKALGYGQTLAWFQRTHPEAWAKLR